MRKRVDDVGLIQASRRGLSSTKRPQGRAAWWTSGTPSTRCCKQSGLSAALFALGGLPSSFNLYRIEGPHEAFDPAPNSLVA